MGVARRWVFPILRILIFAVIAVTLVKLAFFGETDERADPLQPTGTLSDPVVRVSEGTIANDVKVTATVSADTAVTSRATAAGTIKKVLVGVGAQVAAATPVATVSVETPQTDGSVRTTTATVTAGAVGTVSAVPVIVGQVVAVGDAITTVAPPTFHVSGSLEPAVRYRLLNKPTEAQVTISGGPAPFTCTGLSITTPLPGASGGSTSDSDSSGSTGGSTTTVRCAVPDGVTVFDGLSARMTIDGGRAENALIVPTTAVQGRSVSGTVWLKSTTGASVATAVQLGLTDGRHVQVTGGLKAGDRVLRFVPSSSSSSGGASSTSASTGSGG